MEETGRKSDKEGSLQMPIVRVGIPGYSCAASYHSEGSLEARYIGKYLDALLNVPQKIAFWRVIRVGG